MGGLRLAGDSMAGLLKSLSPGFEFGLVQTAAERFEMNQH
jgi:hypothetical protein